MFLSWWLNLVERANSKAKRAKRRRPSLPRRFQSALTVEQLEDRLVPTTGSANVFLNVGSVASPANTISAVRGATVPVFIDFDAISTGNAIVTVKTAGTVTFSYNGSSGGAFTFATGTGGTTAASFQSYIQTKFSALSTATVTGSNGGPFTVTVPTGTFSYLLTAANGTGSATVATNSGLGAGTFYILYDPSVLSISESATSLGSDFKLGSLFSGFSGYSLTTSSGASPGVASFGINHAGASPFVTGAPSGHLAEIDFHVISSAPLSGATLLDFQTTYTDLSGTLHQSNIKDTGANSYTLNPAPKQYGMLSALPSLTQPGVTNPASFSPSDIDTTDASIQIVSGTTPLAPTAVADLFSMAPNTADFSSTMAVAGKANGVLANDTPTANGSMYAQLIGSNTNVTTLPPVSAFIAGASETGMVVTITTSATINISPGEAITISGVSTSGYNGTFEVATTDPISNTFTYLDSVNNGPPILNLQPDPGGTTETATTFAATIYSGSTAHGQIWLNALDGTFAYTPDAGFTGTDSFTYRDVDAASNTPSANTTVTLYVGGVLNIPQTGLGSKTTDIGGQVVVPVNILDPNPVNSGGLGNVTIGINYDPTVFDPNNITINEGDVNTAGGWTAFTANTNVPGQIVITTSEAGGPPPIYTSLGGSLAVITFNVIGLPSSPTGTTVVNISANVPQTSEIDVTSTDNPVVLPMVFPAADNLNFNGAPGPDDGLVQLKTGASNPNTSTTTIVSASAGGSSVAAITYGTLITFAATVSPTSGVAAPALGSVDFKDASSGLDLGTIATDTVVGGNAVFQLVATPAQMKVLQTSGHVHTITANYVPGTGFATSSGTLTGGLTVNPAALTITAVAFTKTYDSTTAAAATPTVSGLVSGDTVTGMAEAFTNVNAGPTKTLKVSAYTINDGNGGNNYAVTTVTNATGVINKAPLTISALTNTKLFDGTTTAAALPTVTGLIGADKVTGLAEIYSDANAGSSKMLSVSAFTINDGNSGNNYAVTAATNTTGVITSISAIVTSTAVQTTQGFVTYGAPVTFTITVTAAGGSASPTGSVEVFDNGSHDLGPATLQSANGLVSTYTLTTLPKTFNAIVVANVPTAHAITVNYNPTGAFAGSTGTLTGGETVAPKVVTIKATTNTKAYDSTTGASATPTVSGLVSGDAITGLTEVYGDANASSGKVLSVSTFTVNDGNGGNNYTVTTVNDTTGLVNKAPLAITALANTKNSDGTTSAVALPTVSGLRGSDKVTGLAEVYSDSAVGTGKTLSVSSYTLNDGNGGNNYSVVTATSTTGVINAALPTGAGTADVFLNLGSVATPAATVSAARATTVPVFIDFDSLSPGADGGLGGGSFYILYDPAVLSVSESATSLGSDVKLGPLLTSLPGNYSLQVAAGFTPGVVSIGLVHTGTAFVTGSPSGHLIEIDFHVVPSSLALGDASLLDLQTTYIDPSKNIRSSLVKDKGFDSYKLSPTPAQYGTVGNLSALTQAGATTPATFSPADSDVDDASIRIVANPSSLIPTANADTYDMAPNIAAFATTMTVTGAAHGVLANDIATANGPIFALLTTAGAAPAPGVPGSFTANTANGTVTLNSADGTFAYTPTANFTGTDSFTYQAVDAVSNNASANATVTIYVGGVLGMPQNLGGASTKIGDTIVVPVNILNPNPANSGGLGNATLGINYDASVFDAGNVAINEGNVNAAAGWTQFTSNTSTPGKIIIVTGESGGAGPIFTTTGGALAYITFHVIGLPSSGNTSVINLAAANPQSTQLAVLSSGNPAVLPLAFAAADNTNFDGAPGVDDGLVTFAPRAPLIYNAAANPAVTSYALRYNPGDGNLELVNAASSATVLAGAPLGSIGAVTITGHSGGSDTLTLDYSAGYYSIPGGISFNGGGAGTLNIQGGGFVTVTDTPSGPGAGTLLLHPSSSNDTTVTYTGLTPINVSSSVANVTMNLPAGTQDAVLKKAANAGMETLAATGSSFESLNFSDPTGTLTINGTPSGAEKVIVQSLNASFDANLTINLQGGTDDIDFTASQNLAGNKTISVAARTINFDATVSAGAIQTSATTVNVNTASVGTTQKLSAMVNGAPTAKITYGTPVTLTCVVTAASGVNAPAGGVVDFQDGGNDLGMVSTGSVSGKTITYTLVTTAKELQVLQANGGLHAITATYSRGLSFTSCAGNLAGGLTVTKAPLVITAVTNTKDFDNSTSAAATPAVTGLVSGDAITFPTGLAEVYADPYADTGKTLSVSAYTLNDGNSGKNYAVTLVSNKTGAINSPNVILTLPNSLTVIEPPQGTTYTVYLPLSVNLPLNYTVSYQTVNGSAVAGTDFVAINPGTVHISDANNTQPSVLLPITIHGGAYQQPGGPAFKSFTVRLNYAVSNGSGNALTQALTNLPNTVTTINLQQVYAPKISIAVGQISASQGVYVNLTTYWPNNPAFSAAQYAQAGGDVYLNYSTTVGGFYFSSATAKIAAANFVAASGTFLIPNIRIPSRPPSGVFTMTLMVVTANASIDPVANMGVIGYP